MGIFSDIYNTVAKFFRPQEEQEGEASKSVATNRLKLVLMQDRTNLTPKILEQMRSELIDLLSRYVELDKELLELNFEQEGDQVALMLSIPVIRAKDEEEIEEAIKAHKEALKEQEEETDEETEVEVDEETSDEEQNEEIDSEETIEDKDENTEIVEEDDSEGDKTSTKSKAVSTPEEMSSDKEVEKKEEVSEEISENR